VTKDFLRRLIGQLERMASGPKYVLVSYLEGVVDALLALGWTPLAETA